MFIPNDASSGPVDAELRAATGNNDLDNGDRVETIRLEIDGNTDHFTVDVDTFASSTLVETHLFVDTDTDRLEKINAGPGRADYNDRSHPEYDEVDTKYEIPLDEIGAESEGESGDELVRALQCVDE